MVYTTRNSLENLTDDRLKRALEAKDPTERDAMFEQAMKATDRAIELSKIDATCEEQARKLESAKEEAKKDRWVRIGEIAATALLSPLIVKACNVAYAKILCEFEVNETFRSSAGRALSKLFKFK